jgi:multiple sugar transport system substrate-binding protein
MPRTRSGRRNLVSFFLQEETLTPYVEGALGRWYPVMKAAAERPFWKADTHRTAVYNQFHAGRCRSSSPKLQVHDH